MSKFKYRRPIVELSDYNAEVNERSKMIFRTEIILDHRINRVKMWSVASPETYASIVTSPQTPLLFFVTSHALLATVQPSELLTSDNVELPTSFTTFTVV